jgi:hypothetical protein
MQYQEAVTEARTLVKRSETDQWRLAELTWEQVNSGISQGQWARDTGMARSHVQYLFRVWRDRPRAASLPNFSDAYVAARHGIDPEESASARQAERAASEIRRLPPERKAEVVREALADPEVAKHTFNAPQADDEMAAKARMHAGNAITTHDQRVQRHIQQQRHEEAVSMGRTDTEALYEVAAMMQVLTDVVVTGGQLARKLSEGATLNAGTRNTLADRAMKARATVDWLETIRDERHAEDIEEVLRVWAAES